MQRFLLLLITFSTFAFECPKGFLCAKGCGLHPGEADKAARTEIAKNFNVRIESQYTSIRSTMGDIDEQFISDSVKEYVTLNLEGVVIENRFEEEGEYCAHAVLNKNAFVERTKEKIDVLTTESRKLSRDDKNLVWARVEKNNKIVRSLAGMAYIFDKSVLGKGIEVPKLQKRFVNLSFSTHVDLKSVEKLIVDKMNKYNVIHGKKIIPLEVKLNLKKKKLNVKGFVKYELEYEFKSTRAGKRLGYSFDKIIESGRSKDIVLERLFIDFEKKIDQIFLDINI
jgi:hypothetical protein